MKLARPRHQPRLFDGDRRDPLLSCLPPQLAAMVRMDAALEGVHASWIIADALSEIYNMPKLSPYFIEAERQRGKK